MRALRSGRGGRRLAHTVMRPYCVFGVCVCVFVVWEVEPGMYAESGCVQLIR